MRDIMVSVAMITYNHEKYIAQAIESILIQKVDFEYEIIIGEDCSSDKTRKIVDKYKNMYPDIVKPIFRDNNIGSMKNSIETLNACKGKYIAVLEGDDYWTDENKLQMQVDYLEKNNDYSCCVHLVQIYDCKLNLDIGVFPSENFDTIVNLEQCLDEYLRNERFLHASSYIFRNFFKDEMNNYEEFLLKCGNIGDLSIIFLIADKGKIKLLNKIMSCYRYMSSDEAYSSGDMRGNINQIIKNLHTINEFFNYKHEEKIKKIEEKYNTLLSNYLKAEKTRNINYEVISKIINAKFIDGNLKIKNYFSKNENIDFAIYGFGTVGKLLTTILISEGIYPKVILDRNPIIEDVGIPTKTLEDKINDIDLIVVTNVIEFERIKEQIISRREIKVESIESII